jgi:NAD(P)-dependent dehydrogenase (short-subunit alcohol dehydrogenase family)
MKSGGHIISIGSPVGECVLVPALVAYSATKGAVKIFTQASSFRWALSRARYLTGSNRQRGEG